DRAGGRVPDRVEHADAAAVLAGDETDLAVAREGDGARARAGRDARGDRQFPGVDGDHLVVLFGWHVDRPAVGAQRHAFGLAPDRDLARHLSGAEIQHAHFGRFFVGDVQRLAVARQVERFGVLTAGVGAYQLARREVDDADAVSRPVGGWQLRFVDA